MPPMRDKEKNSGGSLVLDNFQKVMMSCKNDLYTPEWKKALRAF